MTNVLHIIPNDSEDHEMYLHFSRHGIIYIEGRDEKGWTKALPLGFNTPKMSDYHHTQYLISENYAQEVEIAHPDAMDERAKGEYGRIQL